MERDLDKKVQCQTERRDAILETCPSIAEQIILAVAGGR